MKSRWDGILTSIFDGFWWIVGGKLGRKMEPRSIQEGIEKTIKKSMRFLIDSDGFGKPSWGGKWSQDGHKKSMKQRCQSEGG